MFYLVLCWSTVIMQFFYIYKYIKTDKLNYILISCIWGLIGMIIGGIANG